MKTILTFLALATALCGQMASNSPPIEKNPVIAAPSPAPLTIKWLGKVAIPLIVPRPPHPYDASTILIGDDGKRVEPPKTMVIYQEGYELGLRSDGVVVWREVKP